MVNLTTPPRPSDEHPTQVAPGFRERFRFARVRANKRLKDIAAETEIPMATIEAWSSGKRSPSLGPHLDVLARCLDCDLGWLTTGEGDGNRKYRRSNHPER